MGGLKLLEEARSAGLKLHVEGDRLVIRGPKSAEPIAKALLDRKAEVLATLSAPLTPVTFWTDSRHIDPENPPAPYLNERGELVIPFASDARFHWWKQGGQSIRATLLELGAPLDVLARDVEADTLRTRQ